MASVVEEIEFLIQMYKKASNKQKFLAVLQQLYGENDFSKDAFELMRRIVVADQGGSWDALGGTPAPSKPAPRVAVRKPVAPANDGCSGGGGGRVSSGC
jgi:hypothetical protein